MREPRAPDDKALEVRRAISAAWRVFLGRRNSRSRYRPHQGKREMARRRGEIGWQAKR